MKNLQLVDMLSQYCDFTPSNSPFFAVHPVILEVTSISSDKQKDFSG